MKSPRHFLSDEAIKLEKKKHVPPPGAYNPSKVSARIRCLPKQTSPRGETQADAEFKAGATPGFKYDLVRGEKLTQPKVPGVQMFEAPKQEEKA